MNPILNAPEGLLLQYLFDRSTGRGERTPLDPKSVLRALRLEKVGFAGTLSALTALGFAGARRFRPRVDVDEATECSAVWITGAGERFLKRRQFELRHAAAAARLS
jgi:hypothetical protein